MASHHKIAVLISGRGSNLQSLITNSQSYQITEVISNTPQALGLNIAKDSGIAVKAFERTKDQKLTDFKTEIFNYIEKQKFDFIVLAGFMMILPASFTESNTGKIINIHPSLLPDFPGLDTHKRAIEGLAKTHGCSVHYVDSGMDTGPIIAQASCFVESSDTPATLAARVLTLEHKIYPWVLNKITSGGINLKNNKVVIAESVRAEAQKFGYIVPAT